MNSVDSTTTNEKLLALPEMKVEDCDDYSEHSESALECTDEIEVGDEFKSELLLAEISLNDRSKFSGVTSKLAYCTKCCKTWNHSNKREKKCSVCKSALLYKCGKCRKTYSQSYLLINHQSRKCNKKSSLRCDHCDFKTKYKFSLASHITAKHTSRDQNLNKCNKCGKSFSVKRTLTLHSKVCGRSEDYKRSLMRYCCAHCDYKAESKQNLSTHVQAKHLPYDVNLNRCHKCDKKYSQRSRYLSHLKICGQPKDSKLKRSFCCAHCDYKSSQKIYLVDHIQTKHAPSNSNWNKCTKCGKSYTARSNFLRHSKICGVPKDSHKFCCHDCDYRSDFKQNLFRHIKSAHLPQDPSLHKCDKCGRSYSRKSYLMKHYKSCGQTVSKPFAKRKRLSCGHCSFKSDNKYCLSAHMQAKHLPREPNLIKCGKCEKSFSHQKNLSYHVKVCQNDLQALSEVQRFLCAHCDYKSAFKHGLVQHIQSKHLPKDSFKCKKCQKCYSSEKELRKHLKYVCARPKKKYGKCEKCGKSYSSKQTLRQHLKKVCGKEKKQKNSVKEVRYRCDHCKFECAEKSSLIRHVQLKHLEVKVICELLHVKI